MAVRLAVVSCCAVVSAVATGGWVAPGSDVQLQQLTAMARAGHNTVKTHRHNTVTTPSKHRQNAPSQHRHNTVTTPSVHVTTPSKHRPTPSKHRHNTVKTPSQHRHNDGVLTVTPCTLSQPHVCSTLTVRSTHETFAIVLGGPT